MSETEKVVILGAGIAGISAAYFCGKKEISYSLYEAATRPCGLLDGFEVNGFQFDQAIHLSFATEQTVRDIFDQTPFVTHSPESWCWDQADWLKHPVHNNLFRLPIAEKVSLISQLVAQPDIEISTYKDWLINQYGEGISAKWALPYTEKYWTMPADKLGTQWVGDRVRRADLQEVLHGAFTDVTPDYYYAKEMRYPKTGGYRAFLDPMLADIEIQLDHKVVKIDTLNRQIWFSNGTSTQYRRIINTLPLPKLIEMIDDVPPSVVVAASSLMATSIDLISVGFNVPQIQPHLWFYIYDDDILAARAHSPGIKSGSNVPDGCSSLQFEIYSSPARPQLNSPEEMKENTMMALKRMGIVSNESEVIFMHHKHVSLANVIFDLGMEERRDIVLDWLKSQNIVAAGRFGEWEYFWSNQALMSGKKAVELTMQSYKSSTQ